MSRFTQHLLSGLIGHTGILRSGYLVRGSGYRDLARMGHSDPRSREKTRSPLGAGAAHTDRQDGTPKARVSEEPGELHEVCLSVCAVANARQKRRIRPAPAGVG